MPSLVSDPGVAAPGDLRPGSPGQPGTHVPLPPASGPLLPQIIVEAGFQPASPAGAAGTFVLDSAIQGILNTDALGGTTTVTTWADISVYVHSLTITRASTRVQGPLLTVQASTFSAVLDNSDGRFDPDNTSGPYVAYGATQIRPMIPIRVRAVLAGINYPLFSGHADSWQDSEVTYSAGTAANTGYDEVTLSATDGFKALNGITLAPLTLGVGALEDAGARVSRILTSAGWYPAQRTIATGDLTVQATTYGDTALSLLQLTADSEIGELYVDGGGNVVFRHRRAVLGEARSVTPQAVFGDLDGTTHPAGTELAFASVGRADDDTTLANDVQATNATIGTLQEVTDNASVATFLFPRTYARTDLILTTDSDAQYWAQGILQVSKHGEDRFETLTVDPQADPVNLWPQVLGREYGDRIQVWRRPPGAGTITRDVLIRGMVHTFDASTSAWSTVWTLQDATRFTGFLILNSGTLDSGMLAY